MPTRRDFVRAVGATAATIATAGLASADHREPYDEQPEYVDLIYDEAALETYQPYIVTRHLDVTPTRVYAWVAQSTERSTDRYCYWVYYTTQHGVSPFDSHQHDREPVIVDVDPDTGDIESVVVDGYHYLAKTYPTINTEGDTHPLLHAADKYHFYTATDEVGELVTMESMHEKFEPWMDNDWQADARTVLQPWKIDARRHWWDEGSDGVSMNRLFYRNVLRASNTVPGLNIGGAERADL